MSTTNEKGNELESVVESIEKFLISQNPGLKSENVRIQRKKIVKHRGVTHEIDIYVEIDLGLGDTYVYIFECKNWKDKVGKNEIIIFSEKIKCVSAQTGYFIAKTFTKDAKNQAKEDARIRLLLATPELNRFPLLEFSNSFDTELISAKFGFFDKNNKLIPFDKDSSTLTGEGNKVDYKTLTTKTINNFIEKTYDIPMDVFHSDDEDGFYMGLAHGDAEKLDVGVHIFENRFQTKINGSPILVDNKHEISYIDCEIKIQITITQPTFVWQYDIEKKGKVALVRYISDRGTIEVKVVGSDQFENVHIETQRPKKEIKPNDDSKINP